MIRRSTRKNRNHHKLALVVAISLLLTGFAEAAVHVSANCGCSDGLCIPNAPNYGYYQTSWRTWQTEYGLRPDITFPQSIGVEAIPTPDGVVAPTPPRETLPGATSDVLRGTGKGILPQGQDVIIQEGPPQVPLSSPPGLRPNSGLPVLPSKPEPSFQPGLPLNPDTLQEPSEDKQQSTMKMDHDDSYRAAIEQSKPEPEERDTSELQDRSSYYGLDLSQTSKETPPAATPAVVRIFETRSSLVMKDVQADRPRVSESDRFEKQTKGRRPNITEADLIGTVVVADAGIRQVEHGNPLSTEPKSTRKVKQTPAKSRPLAMDGYCPVELVEHEVWVKGSSDCTTVFRGLRYRMSNEDNKSQFELDPERYAPVLSGCDVVLATEDRRLERGKPAFCVIFAGRLHMFISDETLKRFQRTPKRFAELTTTSKRR